MNRAVKAGLCMLTAFIFGLTVLYPFCLYSQNAFIAKWRTLYIETAMSTMSHQWLATSFIPQGIIDDALRSRYLMQQAQENLESKWDISSETSEERAADHETEQERFFAMFDELDRESFMEYVERRPKAVAKGYGNIDIDYCDAGDGSTGIKTKEGDAVKAINAKEGIMIVQVKGDNYEGRLALIKDASRVSVGTCKNLYSHGQFVRDIAERYDAILATNASGFEDPDGNGNGGTPYGFVKSQGEKLRSAEGGDFKIIGFDEENRLRIGNMKDTSILRDGVEFEPALVIDGEQLVFGAGGGRGVQPSTCIGQKADMTVMLLVIDGRQTHSAGATLGECADVFVRYGAEQASNLDGGSSSVMYYKGREITKPTTASHNDEGRYLPDAFIVT